MNKNEHLFSFYGSQKVRRCNNCLEMEGDHYDFCHTRESLLEDCKELFERLRTAEQERDQYKAELSNARNEMEGISWPHNESIRLLKEAGVDFNGAHGESITYAIKNVMSEIASLRAQLKAAQEQGPFAEIIAVEETKPYNNIECYSRKYTLKYFDHCYKPALGKVGDKLYAAPIPAQQSPAVAVPNSWDEQAYKSACDSLEQWKSRALEAEILLERIRNDMAPTHMGEPLIAVAPCRQVSIPDGWKLVPIKEDVEMRSAGFNCCDVTALKVTEIWAAMVNSSPEPPVIPSPRITEQDAQFADVQNLELVIARLEQIRGNEFDDDVKPILADEALVCARALLDKLSNQ